jgi:hypothetical protein
MSEPNTVFLHLETDELDDTRVVVLQLVEKSPNGLSWRFERGTQSSSPSGAGMVLDHGELDDIAQHLTGVHLVCHDHVPTLVLDNLFEQANRTVRVGTLVARHTRLQRDFGVLFSKRAHSLPEAVEYLGLDPSQNGKALDPVEGMAFLKDCIDRLDFDPNLDTGSGGEHLSVLLSACRNGLFETAWRLLEKGADPSGAPLSRGPSIWVELLRCPTLFNSRFSGATAGMRIAREKKAALAQLFATPVDDCPLVQTLLQQVPLPDFSELHLIFEHTWWRETMDERTTAMQWMHGLYPYLLDRALPHASPPIPIGDGSPARPRL